MFLVIKVALPKSGIAANILKGTRRTSMIVDQCLIHTPTGQFLDIYIEDLVSEARSYGKLLTIPFQDLPRYVSKYSLVYHAYEYSYKYFI